MTSRQTSRRKFVGKTDEQYADGWILVENPSKTWIANRKFCRQLTVFCNVNFFRYVVQELSQKKLRRNKISLLFWVKKKSNLKFHNQSVISLWSDQMFNYFFFFYGKLVTMILCKEGCSTFLDFHKVVGWEKKSI